MPNKHLSAVLGGFALPSCPPDCGHSTAEHNAFDAGLLAGEQGEPEQSDPHTDDYNLSEAWLTGHSVGALNRKHETHAKI